MKVFHALLLACAPIATAATTDIGVSGASVAQAVSAAPLAITDAGEGTGLRWAAWSDRTMSSNAVRLALFDARKTPPQAVWSRTWSDAYDPRFVQAEPWVHGGHPVYALTLRFGAEAQQVDLVALDAAGKPALLAEKLGASVGLVQEAERAAMIVCQTLKIALVPSCFEWRDPPGKLAEIPYLR